MAAKKRDPKVETEPKEESINVEVETEVKEDDRVMVMVPYIEGEDPEVTVIINGHITKFRRGETVRVTQAVAQVLEQSNQQMMVALQNQKKFENPENQRQDL